MKKYFVNKEGQFSYLKLMRNLFIVLILLAAATAGKVLSDINQTIESVSHDVEIKNIRQDKVDITEGDPINVLLIGTDGSSERTETDGDVSRSDTMILVSLNPQTKSTKLLSIPRDAMALIEGVETPDKINHAFAYGGVELTIDTVQEYLDVPIDYYAVINMDGLVELIDAIGGIEVTSPLTFEYRGTGFVEGEKREVNGLKAMNFARMRYDDPEGEVGRQNRQKIVIKAVIDKVLTLDTLSTYPKILSVVTKNVQTNLDLTTAVDISQAYLPALDNISSISFEDLEDMYLNEVFYFYIPLNSRVKVANEIRQHSMLAPISLADLVDPIGEDSAQYAKTMSVIVNQYPSGLTSDQLAQLEESQNNLQTMRDSQYYEQTTPTYPVPNTPTPNPPVVPQTPPPTVPKPPVTPEVPVEPEVPTQPEEPVTPVDPPESTQPTEPTEPVEPPVTTPPVESPTPPVESVPPVSSE